MKSSRRSWRLPGLVLRGRQLLLIDAALLVGAFALAFALRFDAPSPEFGDEFTINAWALPILVTARLSGMVLFRLYQRVWRYASFVELQAILLALASSSAVGYALVYGVQTYMTGTASFPRTIVAIETVLAVVALGGVRLSFGLMGIARRSGGKLAGAQRTLIVGAGRAGASIVRELRSNPALGLIPIGFVDDQELIGHQLLNVPILGRTSDLEAIVNERAIGTVLIALPNADGGTIRSLLRVAARTGARALTIPSVAEVLAGQDRSSIREVQVEDLLRRPPTQFDSELLKDSFRHKRILITGAGGSIGLELARQLLAFEPDAVYLLGRGEGSIFEAQIALAAGHKDTIIEPIIADIRDRARIERLINERRVDVLFHAAAHKHVSLMERFADEAVTVNVLGTLNVLSACERAGVRRLVMISTDKAVKPTSVMGATKRIGELLIADAAARTGWPYCSVRFGNVLSSRGSVLPLFRRQLERGEPITVTDPNVTRYFMTIGEAVQLVLQASVLASGGETFILDMGNPVRILDLARDLLALHDLELGKDYEVRFTGLRPGEKLSEQLWSEEEQPQPTSHPSILRVKSLDMQLSSDAVGALGEAALAGDDVRVRALIRHLVPEFVSHAKEVTRS